MQPHYVNSSNIDALGYRLGHLYVRFKSGVAYQYDKVRFDVFLALERSESVGKTFHQLVKGKYQYTRLESDPFTKRH